ncbi:hypothetical protein niasHS_006705 [Heterodera schachtii]|uniref:Integrin alpha-2 domain-containing protein n=1 Tax=Heterodera schachtii TaxID=97005 RepID=A0ABD2JI14_HETSC
MLSSHFLRCASLWLFHHFSVFLFCTFYVDLAAFNLDLDQPLFWRGPSNSFFGFSIAQHFKDGKPILLIGAPKANSVQPNAIQSGAVFACQMANDFWTKGRRKRQTKEMLEKCEQLQIEHPTEAEFHRPTERFNSKSLHSEGKNHQMLGFVIRSSGRREKAESRAMACAPLLRWTPNAYTNGVCYLLNSELNNTVVINPCDSLPKKDRHNDYGACEQGFSGFVDNHIILTGLPGARKWTGGVFARYEFTDSDGFTDLVDRRTMDVSKEQRGIINVLTSHDYLGYSVRYGRFGFWYEHTEAGEEAANFTVVSGATRYNQTGAVIFLPFWRHVQAENQRQLGLSDDFFLLAGHQLGSGFGSALEVLDLNADGFDDLLVGAPFEFHLRSDGASGGAVYVFYSAGVRRQKGDSARVFRAPKILRGTGAHSQFGAALTRLGNVDNDAEGAQDFAVGAPQSDSGQGSVFIYFGDKWDEFSTEPAQEIHASVLNGRSAGQNLTSFGSALAGGVDMDGDGYVELGVGAHQSDIVALFRARSIVDVQLAHFFPQKQIKIDADNTCSPSAHSCFSLFTSLRLLPRNDSSRFFSRHFADNKQQQPFLCRLQAIPNAKGVMPRALFVPNGAATAEWRCGRSALGGREEKQTHDIYVPKGNQDWTNPLRFNLTVSVSPNGALAQQSFPLPIIDRKKRSHFFDIAFDKKCGEDNECHSELALQAAILDITRREDGIYIAKVTERDSLVIRFLVENRKERAFLAKLFVEYNGDELDEPHLTQKDYQKETPKLDIERRNEGLVVVGLGNPMEAGRKLSFDLAFKLVRGSSERISASLNFRALLNSSSVEEETANNEWSAEVQLIKEADLQLEGASRPSIVRFSKGNRLVTDEVDIGPQVVHVYTITNHGPFYARNVSLKINWPLQLMSVDPLSSRQIASGSWALYTLEEPLIRHNGQIRRCAAPPQLHGQKSINPLGVYNDETLKLDYQMTSRRQRPKRAPNQRTGGTNAEGGTLSATAPLTSIFDNGRIRRKEIEESSGAKVRIAEINCKDDSALCVPLQCHFDYIGRNDSILIEIRARLWNFTFSADYRAIDYIAISSEGFIEVDPNQGILEDVTNNFARVTTDAYPDRPQQEGQIRVWMLLLAVLIGLALLGLLVLCCRMLGFFKRKRPADMHLHQAHYQHNKEFDEG